MNFPPSLSAYVSPLPNLLEIGLFNITIIIDRHLPETKL
jgi:hypothetical protein